MYRIVFAAIIVFPAASLGEMIRFYDDDFSSSWQNSCSGSFETCETVRIPSNSFGSGYHSTEVVGFSFQSQVTYTATHFWDEAAYSIGEHLPIDSITFSMTYNAAQAGHIFRLVGEQDGRLIAGPEFVASDRSGWRNYGVTLDPNSLPGLDNSPNASTIRWGYQDYSGSTGLRDSRGNASQNGSFYAALYDLKITPVPEPSSFALTIITLPFLRWLRTFKPQRA